MAGGRAVKGGVPPRARPSPQGRPALQASRAAGPRASRQRSITRTNRVSGCPFRPGPQTLPSANKSSVQEAERVCSSGKAEIRQCPRRRRAHRARRPAGLPAPDDFSAMPGGVAVDALLVRRRGASMARPGGVGAAPRPAAKASGRVVNRDARAQECGREPSPRNEHGLLHGVGRHAQNRCHGPPREATSSSWWRSGREKADPCWSRRAPKAPRARHLVAAKERGQRPERSDGRCRQRRAAPV